MKGRAWAKNELPTADPQWAPAAIKISLKTDQEIGTDLSTNSVLCLKQKHSFTLLASQISCSLTASKLPVSRALISTCQLFVTAGQPS